MVRRPCLSAVALVSLLVPLGACSAQEPASSPSPAAADACIKDFKADTDYFATKIKPDVATNFSVDYHNSYAVATVKKPNASEAATSVVLVRCGAPAPALDGDLAEAPRITVPVAKINTTATTQIASFELLDSLDRIAGVGDAKSVISDKANKLISDGAIADLSSSSGDFDVEKAFSTKADVTMQTGSASPNYAKLRELGMATVPDGSSQETSPLGRAEWIKFYSLLLGKEEQGNTVFSNIQRDYESARSKVAAAQNKPKVLTGTEAKGTWTVPGADGYIARYITDAGGENLFADKSGTGNQKLDNEAVLSRGQDAAVWLNGNWMSKDRWATKADALAVDPRYAELPAFQNGAVWNPTKRAAAKSGGGNDYWESGVVRPDIVLADIAQILHPELFPGRELYYYQQLQEG